MLKAVNRILRRTGIEIRRIRADRTRKSAISLKPTQNQIGRALLSYVTTPFLLDDTSQISNEHTHHWESFQIAQSFLSHGFAVDVVHYEDRDFVPDQAYDVLVSARTNLERLARLLPERCLKIAHLDTAHYLTHNAAVLDRLLSLRNRSAKALRSPRMLEDNWAIEVADMGCVLGNDFTADSYAYAGKPIYKIPLSTVRTYDWDESKDHGICSTSFVWFGSGGMVHKGLDRVLEAFRDMPELRLAVCGPLEHEKRFTKAFESDLFHLPNVEAIGWIDVEGDKFRELMSRSVATIYPSCSEGGGGSVLTCMHAGLIPVVTPGASVEIENFGILLETGSVDEIRQAARRIASLSGQELQSMAKSAWSFAREHHTREVFADHYDNFVGKVVLPEVLERKGSG